MKIFLSCAAALVLMCAAPACAKKVSLIGAPVTTQDDGPGGKPCGGC